MRKTIVLNSDEMFTLFLISKLNNDLLTNGLTKENIDSLIELQFELLNIVSKFHK